MARTRQCLPLDAIEPGTMISISGGPPGKYLDLLRQRVRSGGIFWFVRLWSDDFGLMKFVIPAAGGLAAMQFTICCVKRKGGEDAQPSEP